MNVIIFGKGFGRPRQISLSGRAAGGIATVVAGCLCAAAFAGGFWYSTLTGSGVSLEDARAMAEKLTDEREAIATIRQETEDKLDALAIRIGQMNARVIRLDALGRRLTEMADIDAEEFDFSATPAMGGPEEPTIAEGAAGEGAAVPEVLTAMADLGYQLDSHEAQLSVLESVLMNQNLSERVYPKRSARSVRLDVVVLRPANRPVYGQAGYASRRRLRR